MERELPRSDAQWSLGRILVFDSWKPSLRDAGWASKSRAGSWSCDSYSINSWPQCTDSRTHGITLEKSSPLCEVLRCSTFSSSKVCPWCWLGHAARVLEFVFVRSRGEVMQIANLKPTAQLSAVCPSRLMMNTKIRLETMQCWFHVWRACPSYKAQVKVADTGGVARRG